MMGEHEPKILLPIHCNPNSLHETHLKRRLFLPLRVVFFSMSVSIILKEQRGQPTKNRRQTLTRGLNF